MAGTQQGSFTNFPQGFAFGLSVRGMPLTQMQPGQVFFVDNSPVLNPSQKAASNGNRGTFLDPFATLTYAVNTACVPGRGDIVFVGSNHKETLADAVTLLLNCSGVAVIGLGAGSIRPTFTFTTATTANIPVGGANISVQNCLFVANFAAVASCFTATATAFTGVISGNQLTTSAVTGTIQPGMTIAGTGVTLGTVIYNQVSGTTGGAGVYTVSVTGTVASASMTTSPTDFAYDNCEFRDTSSSLNFVTAFTAPSTDNACDGLSATRNSFFGLGTTTNTAFFALAGNLDRWTVQGNYYASPLAANGVLAYQATTTKVLTRVLIDGNRFSTVGANAATGLLLLTTATTNTGVISNNFGNGARAIATAIWVTASSGFKFYQNFYETTADASGVILPAYNT